MAEQMKDRLDGLYVRAVDRDHAMMHARAASACARWCAPSTTHAQVARFIDHQLAQLDGLEDSLSREIRESWQWLADELGPAPVSAPAATARSRRGLSLRRATALVDPGARLNAV